MKDLIADFQEIWKKDKRLLWWMAFNVLLAAVLFLLPIFALNPEKRMRIVRYSDGANGYSEDTWYYLLSFLIMAVVMGVGHVLLGARLYKKRGRDIARLFYGVSMAMIVVAIMFARNLIGEG